LTVGDERPHALEQLVAAVVEAQVDPELKELAGRDDLVVVIPTATLEDPRLPPSDRGYTPHHFDFPGSVTLRRGKPSTRVRPLSFAI
jgi:hypothetical protein